MLVPPRNAARPTSHANAPQPSLVFLAAFVASLVWHALVVLTRRIEPAFADLPLVLVPILGALAIAVSMAGLLRHWGSASGWNDRNRLALASVAVVSHNIMGGAILTKTTTDRVAVAGLGLALVILLILFAIRVRHRVEDAVRGTGRGEC